MAVSRRPALLRPRSDGILSRSRSGLQMDINTDYVSPEKKSKETSPSPIALCVMLAGGNHVAGVLLASIVYWSKYGRAKIPKFNGYWIANKRAWWMREACLSSDQFNRAISKLEKSGLVERCQFWFGNRNILHVRPTPTTLDFVQSSKTWKAAKEFYADLELALIHSNENNEIEHLSSANMQTSNETSKAANPSLADSIISKDMSNVLSNPNKKLTSAHSATPLCAVKNGLENKKVDTGNNKNNINKKSKKKTFSSLPIQDDSTTIKHVAAIWSAAVSKYFPGAVASSEISPTLEPKDLGLLANIVQGLAYNFENPEAIASDILAFMIELWPGLELHGKPEFPAMDFACGNLPFDLWEKSGRPSYSGLVMEKTKH